MFHSGRTASKHNVRKKVLIPLSLTFAVLIVAFVWAGYGIRQAGEQRLLAQHIQSALQILQGGLEEEVAVLTSTAGFITSQPLLQQAIEAQDVQGLLDESLPLLDRLATELHLSHFYYYDPQGILLLRVYFPEDRSRSAGHRKTMLRSMATGQPEAGLEIGRHGTVAQRLVFPWRQGNRLIGYIELGTELKHILEKLKRSHRVDLTLAIDKSNFSRANWDLYSAKTGAFAAWGYLPDKIISDTTILLPQETASRIFSASTTGLFPEEFHFDSRVFRGALHPLADSPGERVGDLLVLVEITGHKADFYLFLFWVAGFSLLLSAALFGFSYRVLGQVGTTLMIGENRLRQESANLAAVNRQLVTEIDAHKRTEQQLVDLNQTLEQRVVERTKTLEQQNILLEQNRTDLDIAYRELTEKQTAILHQDKMACIGQMAAGIAHDINNPVGFVSHNLMLFDRYFQRLAQFVTLQQALIDSLAVTEMQAGWQKGWRDFKIGEIFDEIPLMLGECQDGTTRITQIVHGLRSFIRSDSLKYEQTDLHRCLDSTLALLRHELGTRIRVVREYAPIPRCICYPQQMNQLFMNLLLNACQAIVQTGEIRITTWAEKEQIFILIRDDGCGISAANLEKIYEPFFTTKPIGVGTGLGLSIVYEVTTRHHGRLMVKSALGRGSSFTLTFPVDCRGPSRRTEAEADHPTAGAAHD